MRETVQTAVEDATRRFQGATEEMRKTAAGIREELSSTREEIRRGVFELPEETRDSTEAMRRAVSDQIRALRDLSEIVNQSGRAFDVGPRRTGAETAAPRPEPRPSAAAAQPVERQSAPAVSETRIAREAQTAQRMTASFGNDGNLARDLTGMLDVEQTAAEPAQASASSFMPPPIQQAPAAKPQPAVTAEPERQARGGGWVSDLLRRASREEEEEDDAEAQAPEPVALQAAEDTKTARSPEHVVESLNSLSVDIARAIDHNASVDLWDRYRRGERNVFTRRLYTMKGQQTFDEIRRKYQRDGEFRSAVDRYIADFETLLADVARRDPENALTRTYLSSDTGKVYTMLAHASGRFDA
jgi:hypothetical protein